jgi:hypothetical protein
MRTLLNLFISVAVALAPIVASAGKPPADEGKALFQKVSPSVVTVEAGDSVGTGFLIRDRKTIVTAAHVISDGDTPFIRVGKSTFMSVEKIAISTEKDIAVLYLGDELKSKPLQLGDKKKVSPGERVYAIGSALGSLTNTLTDGLVSSLRESEAMTYIQTTAPFSPGMSGGPVVSPQGTVLGVISFTLSEGQNLNIAVHAKHIRELLEKTPAKTSVVVEALKLRRKANPTAGPTDDTFRMPDEATQKDDDKIINLKALAALYSEIFLQLYILEASIFDLAMDAPADRWEDCYRLMIRVEGRTPLIGVTDGKFAREDLWGPVLMSTSKAETDELVAATLKMRKANFQMVSATSELILSRHPGAPKSAYDKSLPLYTSSRIDFDAVREKLLETIQNMAKNNMITFLMQCSPFVYSFVGDEFGIYANTLRNDEAVVARVYGDTYLERDDVIVGVRFIDDPEFTAVKNWRDFSVYYSAERNKGQQIIVKLSSGTKKVVRK